MTNLNHLKEKLAKATTWESQSEYILALLQSAPALIAEVEALREFKMDVEKIHRWLLGEEGDFPNLADKPHYKFRTKLRPLRDAALKRLEDKLG